MQETILWATAGVIFWAGMAVGVRIQESGTAKRERRIAAERRELSERTRVDDARGRSRLR